MDRALAWLDAHQFDDGSWSFDLVACPGCRGACRHSGNALLDDDRVGVTALAVLPFLGRGHTHRDGSYRRSVDRGISLLADTATRRNGVMQARGSAHGLYVQGLAGIALSECYGMTRDRRLVRPTQFVIDHIMAAQDPRVGGWRYAPGQAGDTSVVGWQIMALTSAQLASRRAWRRNSGNSGGPGPWGLRDPRRDRRRQRRQSGTAARADPPVRDRRAHRTGRDPTAHSARPADSTGPGLRSPS